MTPAVYNMTCPQGSTFTRTLTYKSNGSPVNLTSYTARMQARLNYASATTVLSLTSGSGIALGGSAGTITITISASATAAINPNSYVYDLELESAGGEVTRLIEGNFVVSPEVTR